MKETSDDVIQLIVTQLTICILSPVLKEDMENVVVNILKIEGIKNEQTEERVLVEGTVTFNVNSNLLD